MTTTPAAEHKAQGPRSVRCFIVTISDTRTEATDTSGRAIASLLTAAGHSIVGRVIVRDEPDLLRQLLDDELNGDFEEGSQAIITTGGTGIASRDTTIEVVEALIEKRLEGFGELFRMLSFHEIGAAAMLSRATGGLARGRILIALPGAENAVRLAMEKLVIPELGHLVQQASR